MNDTFSEIVMEDGEQILWLGKPQQRVGVGQWWKLYLGSLVSGVLLIWSFTGVETPFCPGLCEFLADPFCRFVLVILTLGIAVFPSLAAYSTNASDYCITNRRIVVRKPHIKGGHYTESHAYADMVKVAVKPVPGGDAALASLSFDYQSGMDNGRVQELLYAIPRVVAEDAEKLAAQAQE